MRVLTQFRSRCAARFEASAARARSQRLNHARVAAPTAAPEVIPSRRVTAAIAARDAIPVTTLIRDWYGIRERPAELLREYRRGAAISAFLVRVAVTGGFVAYLLIVAELGGRLSGQSHAIAEQPVPQSASQTHTPGHLSMGPVSTGVAEVDNAVRGFLAGDVDGAFSKLAVQQIGCGTLPSGGAPFLPCLATEPRGTVHELILSTCKPKWVTGDAARTELATVLADTPGVYAIDGLNGSYTAVLSWPDALDRSLVLTISPVGVTSYGIACGPPLDPNPGRKLGFATAPGG
jgi:hypothetical protein